MGDSKFDFVGKVLHIRYSLRVEGCLDTKRMLTEGCRDRTHIEHSFSVTPAKDNISWREIKALIAADAGVPVERVDIFKPYVRDIDFSYSILEMGTMVLTTIIEGVVRQSKSKLRIAQDITDIDNRILDLQRAREKLQLEFREAVAGGRRYRRLYF